MMIRRLCLLIFLCFQLNLTFAQTSLEQIDLAYGRYKVGYRSYTTADSTRTYSRMNDYRNQKVARPIIVSLWYPSNQSTISKKPLKILNYFEVLKAEEEWAYLPNEQLLNWFKYIKTPENESHLTENTRAYAELEFVDAKFPVLVYTPGLHGSSVENFALCEYLASHGFVVIASASRGTDIRWFSNNNPKEMETQARDMEFLITEATKFPMVDRNKVAAIGYSFGGLSNIIAQSRNDNIKVVVSLDGTERYQYALVQKSPFFNVDKLDIPYLHMAQKDIPEDVLKEDKIDPKLNTIFELYDNLQHSKAYKLKFNNLTHSYFSSLEILFQKRDKRQDKSDAAIMESYKWVTHYTLNFLNAFLKNDAAGLTFMENQPSENGVPAKLISKESKDPAPKTFTFQDFNERALKQGYKDLIPLYKDTKEKYPALQLPEGALNTIGLQLVFNPNTSQQGINVFLLAVELYPTSANLFDSLAEAYLFLGEKEKAIMNFEKSLELYPQNQNAINRLKQLGKK